MIYLQKSKDVGQQLFNANHMDLGNIYLALGECLDKLNNYTEAKFFYLKAKDIFEYNDSESEKLMMILTILKKN